MAPAAVETPVKMSKYFTQDASKSLGPSSGSSTNVASPDLSLPSMAETSYASSPEDESRLPSARRTLFKMEDEEAHEYTKVMTIAESTRVRPSPSRASPIKYETVLVSGKKQGSPGSSSIISSTTSSEMTAIPSWNLSRKETEDTEEGIDMKRFVLSPLSSDQSRSISTAPGWKQRYQTWSGTFLSSTSSKEPGLVFEEARPFYAQKQTTEEGEVPHASGDVQKDVKEHKTTPVMVEEQPEPPTSCTTALNLTPAQLAEIFLAFGQSTREKVQPSDHNDSTTSSTEATSSPSPMYSKTDLENEQSSPSSPSRTQRKMDDLDIPTTPRIRSLQRENDAFKKIVEQDAHTILNLQRAVETQKQLCSLKEVEIVDRQTELQISEDRIARLKKERTDYTEREIELVETIKILKREVDRMTLKTEKQYDYVEVQRIEAELEAEKGQTASLATRVVQLESSLKEKDDFVFELQTEIDYLKDQKKQSQNPQPSLVNTGNLEDDSELPAMIETSQVLTLAGVVERLETLEKTNKQREDLLMAALERTNNEMELARLHLGAVSHDAGSAMVKISDHPQEIEAMALNNNGSRSNDDADPFGCCCGLMA